MLSVFGSVCICLHLSIDLQCLTVDITSPGLGRRSVKDSSQLGGAAGVSTA